MNIFRTAIFAAATLLLSGCATLFGDNDRQVSVNSNPQGGQLYVNNQYVGATPSTVTLNNIWNPTVIQVKMKGRQPASTTIDSKFQPVGLWNLLFWPGFIVDAISGDMMKIPEGSHSVTVNFPPQNA